MTKAEEFRLNAREAEREAEHLSGKDPVTSGIYGHIAAKRHEMADQAERQGL